MVIPVPANSSVRPSGCALATYRLPMLVLPPVLFSTMTLAPRISASLGAITRASGSLTAPAVNGTTIVTVLPARSCAAAGSAASISVARTARSRGFMFGPVRGGVDGAAAADYP